MRLGEGVELAAHACAVLAVLEPGKSMPGIKLAEHLAAPPAYMAKHLQALSRAGLVDTGRGPAGGYRLARRAAEITLNDIALAVEGREPAFRCTEVRQRGPHGAPPAACLKPCGIAAAFYAAERAWRAELAKVTLVDVIKEAAESYDAERGRAFAAWVAANAR